MFYPREIVGEVSALNDILDVVSDYVTLKPRSGNHFGLCPFHAEKTPSFSVIPEKQMFHCFGCGSGGSVLTFIMRIENLDFVDAVKFLADRVRYTLPEKGTSLFAQKQAASREISAQLNKRAALFYHEYLYSDNADATLAREYLTRGRGVQQNLAKRFGLGLSPPEWGSLLGHLANESPENLVSAGLAVESRKSAGKFYDRFRSRLMFPIIDSRGRVVGFGGRTMQADKDEAKYINSPETSLFHKSDQLYGLNLARKTRLPEMIIVEGYMDVLAMHQAGFTNTVGVLGTALTESHARLLKRAGCQSVVLVLDSDNAGIKAALKAIPILIKSGLKVKVLNISESSPEAKDPDEYLQKFGAAALAKLIALAKSHIVFRVNLLKGSHDLATTDGRVDFTHEAAKILAELESDIETDVYAKEIGQASDISPAAIHAEIRKQRGLSDSADINIPRNIKQRGRLVQDRGVVDAKKGLLNLILTHTSAARALHESDFLMPQEMGEGIYTKLLVLAFENCIAEIESSPSDIINVFETPEEQQYVAEIFATSANYPSIEKALNDMAAKIKRAWIKSQVLENDDLNAVNTLKLLEKNMAGQYITMSNG